MASVPEPIGADAGEITTDDDASFVEDKSTPAWRQFELDVVRTVQDLDPAAEVLHDQKTMGRLSGVPRQLDAIAKKSIAGARIRVVIECKQYKRKLGIGKIDEFVGKLIDVGAAHGILYATSGVTEPARRRAEAAIQPEITLRDLSDVASLVEHMGESEQDMESLLTSQAANFSELIEDVVLGSCQGEYCWYGEVNLEEIDGILTGACDSCGLLHVRCACCEELVEIYWSSADSCFSCGAKYRVLSYQGDVDGMEQISHGVDCEENHNLEQPA